MKYTKQILEQRVEKLREEWKNAKIEDRRLIEIRANIFKRLLEKQTI